MTARAHAAEKPSAHAMAGAELLAFQRLNQEQAAFEQRLHQNAQWFNVQRTVVYGAVVGLLAILVGSGYILLSGSYSAKVTAAAATFIFGDMVSLFASVWKVVLKGAPNGPVEPTTALALSDGERNKLEHVSLMSSRRARGGRIPAGVNFPGPQ